MAVFQRMFDFISKYLTVFRLPRVGVLDVLEMFPEHREELLKMFDYKMETIKNPQLWEQQDNN